MLAGFQQYGLQPGPLLFANNPGLVWGLVASLFVANVMLIILNLPLVGLWVRLLAIPRAYLYAGILLFATLGTLGANPRSSSSAYCSPSASSAMCCAASTIRSRRSSSA
jgi:putative tricarboxylic transport membrane protein